MENGPHATLEWNPDQANTAARAPEAGPIHEQEENLPPRHEGSKIF
jgi:hypothetical protein